MYDVKANNFARILLYNGLSVILSDDAVDIIYENKKLPDYYRVIRDVDSEAYQQRYGGKVVYDEEFIPLPEPQFGHTGEEEEILEWIRNLPKRDANENDSHYQRLNQELAFFQKTNTVPFLGILRDLIREFQENDIVWAGRGSSCASYVLYLMGVHDVNPIKYNIDFKEFSKEDNE